MSLGASMSPQTRAIGFVSACLAGYFGTEIFTATCNTAAACKLSMQMVTPAQIWAGIRHEELKRLSNEEFSHTLYER